MLGRQDAAAMQVCMPLTKAPGYMQSPVSAALNDGVNAREKNKSEVVTRSCYRRRDILEGKRLD